MEFFFLDSLIGFPWIKLISTQFSIVTKTFEIFLLLINNFPLSILNDYFLLLFFFFYLLKIQYILRCFFDIVECFDLFCYTCSIIFFCSLNSIKLTSVMTQKYYFYNINFIYRSNANKFIFSCNIFTYQKWLVFLTP